MRVIIKGSKLPYLKTISDLLGRLSLIGFIGAFLSISVISNAAAQDKAPAPQSSADNKPQLVEIVLNEKTSDPEAIEIVKKLLNKNAAKKIDSNHFNAKFIPIQKNGSSARYIYSVFTDPDFGGCYARGCYTVVYRNSPNTSKWNVVFGAFVFKSFYDANSTTNRPANLIFSSNPDASNPGVWMWNGMEYMIVNNKP